VAHNPCTIYPLFDPQAVLSKASSFLEKSMPTDDLGANAHQLPEIAYQQRGGVTVFHVALRWRR
jgi:hypothetical protein